MRYTCYFVAISVLFLTIWAEAQTGSIKVTLNPQEVRDEGALWRWRRQTTGALWSPWYESGHTVTELQLSTNYEVEFSMPFGWYHEPPETNIRPTTNNPNQVRTRNCTPQPFPGLEVMQCRPAGSASPPYAPLPTFSIFQVGGPVTSWPAGAYDFCAYLDTLYCSLPLVAGQVDDPMITQFADVILCLNADINGPLDPEEEWPFTGNDIPDGQYELAILAEVLNDVDHPLHQEATDAFKHNFAEAKDILIEAFVLYGETNNVDILQIIYSFAPHLAGSMAAILGGYAVLGDEQTYNALDELFEMLSAIGMEPIPGGIAAITDAAPALGPEGDANGDGFTNKQAYYWYVGHLDYPPWDYSAAAVDPNNPLTLLTLSGGGSYLTGHDVLLTAHVEPLSGTPVSLYSWYKDSVFLAETEEPELHLPGVQLADTGLYEVEVALELLFMPEVEIVSIRAATDVVVSLPPLTVTPPNQEVSAAAGQIAFEIETPAAWTAISDSDWATVLNADGVGNASLILEHDHNDTGADRAATITVAGDGTDPATVIVTLTQARVPPLTVTPANRNIDGAAGQTQYDIQTTEPWDAVSEADWATVVNESGTGDATLNINYVHNYSGAVRVAAIIVTGIGTDPESLAVTLTQTPVPPLVVTPDSQQVDNAAGQTQFNIETTEPWDAVSDAGWATIVNASGTGNSLLNISYGHNDTGAERIATITITGEGTFPASIEATLVQAPVPPLVVTPGNRNVDNTNGQTLFEIETTAAWSALSDSYWATIVNNSGVGNAELTVTYAQNEISTERTAAITITGVGTAPETVEVTLTQAAAPTLTVTPASRHIDNPAGGSTTFSIVTDAAWEAVSNTGWAVLDADDGEGAAQLTVDCDANETDGVREATITVTGDGTDPPSVAVTVTQTPDYNLEITSPHEHIISPAGTSIPVDVSTFASWTVETSHAWLHIDTPSGTGPAALNCNVTQNDTHEDREGIITIFGVMADDAPTEPAFIDVTVTQLDEVLAFSLAGNPDIMLDYGALYHEAGVASIINRLTGHDVIDDVNAADVVVSITGPEKAIYTSTLLDIAADFNALFNTSPGVYELVYYYEYAENPFIYGAARRTVTVKPPSLEISPDYRHVSSHAGAGAFNIITPVAWLAETDAEWVDIVNDAGAGNAELNITYTENDGDSVRIATITVAGADTVPATVAATVRQEPADGLAASPSARTVGVAAGDTTFDIITNAAWTAETDNAWLHIQESSGSGLGVLAVSFAQNDTDAVREGIVTISGELEGGAPTNPPFIELAIVQLDEVLAISLAGAPDVALDYGAPYQEAGIESIVNRLTNEDILGDVEATSVQVTITSDTMVQHVSSLAAIEEDFNALYNTTPDIYELMYFYEDPGGVLVYGEAWRTVTVGLPPLEVIPGNRNVASHAGAIAFDIITPVGWQAESDADWANIADESGEGNAALIVDYSQHEAGEERVAVITITGAGTLPPYVEVTLTQEPDYGLEIMPSLEYIISPAEATIPIDISTYAFWTAQASHDWLNVDTPSGLGPATLSITVSQNDTAADREGVITVSGIMADGASTTEPAYIDVTVTQLDEVIAITLAGDPSVAIDYGADYQEAGIESIIDRLTNEEITNDVGPDEIDVFVASTKEILHTSTLLHVEEDFNELFNTSAGDYELVFFYMDPEDEFVYGSAKRTVIVGPGPMEGETVEGESEGEGEIPVEGEDEGEGETPVEGESEGEGEGETPAEGEDEGEGETPAEGEDEGEGETPAEGEDEGEGETPAEGEDEGEGETPAEGEDEGEGETPAEGEDEGEGETPAEGEGEGETPVEGEDEGEGETPAEGEGEGEGETPVEGEDEGEGETPVEGEDEGEGEPDDIGCCQGGCNGNETPAEAIKHLMGDWLLIGLSLLVLLSKAGVRRRR